MMDPNAFISGFIQKNVSLSPILGRPLEWVIVDSIGLNCILQSEMDECLSDPCQNDGYCDDSFLGYECFCRNGFTGNTLRMTLYVCETKYNFITRNNRFDRRDCLQFDCNQETFLIRGARPLTDFN